MIVTQSTHGLYLVKQRGKNVVLDAFKQIIKANKGVYPLHIWVDRGSEFLNKQFQKYINDNGCSTYSTYGRNKSVIVERFNRTLKTAVRKRQLATLSRRWIDMLPEIVKRYNNTVHTTIKLTPAEAHNKNTAELAINNAEQQPTTKKRRPMFKVGDIVRLARVKGVFEKGYDANFSAERYKIKNVIDSDPTTYRITTEDDKNVNGIFYEQQLQKSKVSVKVIEKVLDRKIEKRKRYILVKFYGYKTPEWFAFADLKQQVGDNWDDLPRIMD